MNNQSDVKEEYVTPGRLALGWLLFSFAFTFLLVGFTTHNKIMDIVSLTAIAISLFLIITGHIANKKLLAVLAEKRKTNI